MNRFRLKLRQGLTNLLTFSSNATFDSLTALDDVVSGAVLANVGNLEGATLTISPNDGRIIVSGDSTQLLRGTTAVSDGSITYTWTKSKAGYQSISGSFVFTFTFDPPLVGPAMTWAGTALSGFTAPAMVAGRSYTINSVGTTDFTAYGASANIVGTIFTANGPGVGTGIATPADPVRTTAKPAVHWWQPSELRLSGDTVIGVDADANGGVAYVDFWVEGAVQRVSRSLYTDTDVNGKPRKRLGFWIKLDSTKFKTISTTGTAQIFATATPNDGSMQARTIGYTESNPGGTGGRDGNRKMLIYPRTTAHDFVKTVGAAGDYTTLDAAIAAIKSGTSTDSGGGSVQSAQLTLLDNTSYELSTVGTTLYTGAKGFHTIKAASGVNATIGRAVFPAGVATSWPIDPRIECLEFQGSGITVDFRNMSVIGTNSYTRGFNFNGCNVTNSIGTRDSLYWHKGAKDNAGSPIAGYVNDCNISYVSSFMGLNWQLMATGNTVNMVEGHLWSGTHFVANNYVRHHDIGYFRTPVAAMTISYDGHGGSTATLSKTGGNDDNTGGTLVLTSSLGGTASKTYTLGRTLAATWVNVSDIVADINANVTGWTATLLDDTRRSSSLLAHRDSANHTQFGNSNGFSNAPVTATPITLDCWFDHHGDGTQFFTNGSNPLSIRENVLHRGNIVRGIGDGGFVDAFGSDQSGVLTLLFDANINDCVYSDNIYEYPLTYHGNTSQGMSSGHTYSHFYFRNVVHESGTSIVASGGGTFDSYSCYEQCVLGGIFPEYYPSSFAIFKDCYVAYGWEGNAWVNTAPNSGNSTEGYTTFQLENVTTAPRSGDFRPKVNMPTKASISPYDVFYNSRLSTDAVGAVSLAQTSAPGYPF